MKKLLDWSLRLNAKLGTRVIGILSIALSLSFIAVIFTDTWIASIPHQNAQIGVVRDNIIALHQLRTNLFKAESAQRGFMLTQRAVHLDVFNEAINDAREDLKKIEGLVTTQAGAMSDGDEKEWLLNIGSSLEGKISEMQLTLYLTKQGKLKEATAILLTNKGLVDRQKLIESTQQLLDSQTKALEEFRSTRTNTIVLARTSVYGSTFVLILLVILVIRQLLQEMAARDQLRIQLDNELERYETQLEERTKLLKALALDAQSDVERERQKLARELHDELGSILTATKMDVSWAVRQARESVPAVSEKLSKTILYLDRGIQFKREVVQNLHPSMIETFGFWSALRSLIDDMKARNQWEMDVILPEETTEISETVSLIVYRVIQETLNNATKYAQATKITLHMIIELGYLKLELEDNGVGLDMNKIVEGATHGLKGMKNRVMAIGGHFEVESAPGKGMISRVIIPLDTARDATPDTARDRARDSARDVTRDSARDEVRDEVRDGVRDTARDKKGKKK